MKQLIMSLILLCAWIIPVYSVQAATAQDAQALVKDTTDKMLTALKAEKANLDANPKRVYALVDQIVLPHFDFARMSRFVLGQNWKIATPEQQERFVKEFRTLLVRTYSTALVKAAGKTVNVKYLQARPEDNAERINVKTQVEYEGKAIGIDYEMYVLNGEWKVYNIVAEGVSLVTNYRTEFEDDIRSKGMDKLIEKIASRNQEAQKPK